mgnify:CR=1 FL=1
MLLLFLLLMMIDWVWEHWGSFVRSKKLPHCLVSTLMLVEILQTWHNISLKLKLKIKAGPSSFPTITGYTIIVLPVLPSAENRSIISLLTSLLFYNHWKGHCTAHSPRLLGGLTSQKWFWNLHTWNTIFTLNFHIFCQLLFFSLHMWKIHRNLQSPFLHFARNCVFTFFALWKP